LGAEAGNRGRFVATEKGAMFEIKVHPGQKLANPTTSQNHTTTPTHPPKPKKTETQTHEEGKIEIVKGMHLMKSELSKFQKEGEAEGSQITMSSRRKKDGTAKILRDLKDGKTDQRRPNIPRREKQTVGHSLSGREN